METADWDIAMAKMGSFHSFKQKLTSPHLITLINQFWCYSGYFSAAKVGILFTGLLFYLTQVTKTWVARLISRKSGEKRHFHTLIKVFLLPNLLVQLGIYQQELQGHRVKPFSSSKSWRRRGIGWGLHKRYQVWILKTKFLCSQTPRTKQIPCSHIQYIHTYITIMSLCDYNDHWFKTIWGSDGASKQTYRSHTTQIRNSSSQKNLKYYFETAFDFSTQIYS